MLISETTDNDNFILLHKKLYKNRYSQILETRRAFFNSYRLLHKLYIYTFHLGSQKCMNCFVYVPGTYRAAIGYRYNI